MKKWPTCLLWLSKCKFSLLAPSLSAYKYCFLTCLSSGGIPHAYTLLARDFYRLIQERNQTEHIYLYEYVRDKWTFHAKGLWYYFPNESWPSLTLIGSPNFGHRSVYRDLEAQVAIVTNNQSLREALHEEKNRLYKSAQCVTNGTFTLPERKIPVWVYCVTRLIKNFLWHVEIHCIYVNNKCY